MLVAGGRLDTAKQHMVSCNKHQHRGGVATVVARALSDTPSWRLREGDEALCIELLVVELPTCSTTPTIVAHAIAVAHEAHEVERVAYAGRTPLAKELQGGAGKVVDADAWSQASHVVVPEPWNEQHVTRVQLGLRWW